MSDRGSYLWVDGLEARVLLVHLEVELRGGDGQGSLHHHGRRHHVSAGAHVDWAWRRHGRTVTTLHYTTTTQQQAPWPRCLFVDKNVFKNEEL